MEVEYQDRQNQSYGLIDVNRIALGKCTHVYDETQGTMKHKRYRQKIVFVSCKKTDR